MKKGGYKIINLNNNDLSQASFTLDGVYEEIEGNYQKALLLSGIIIDGVEKADVFVTAEIVNSKYVIKAYDKTLTIDSDDLIAIADGGNHLYVHYFEINFKDDNDTEIGYTAGKIFTSKNTITKDDVIFNGSKELIGNLYNSYNDNDNPVRLVYCDNLVVGVNNRNYIELCDFNLSSDNSEIDFNIDNTSFDVYATNQLF